VLDSLSKFQWAPTLGGECYIVAQGQTAMGQTRAVSMGTHPWG